MTEYTAMSQSELMDAFVAVKQDYARLVAQGLQLDMSRGKPGPDQMDLSRDIFELVSTPMGFKNKDGIDCRNYGGLDGLTELKNLFSQILGVSAQQIIVGGNSSLNMMFDTISQAMTHGWSLPIF